MSMMAPDPDEEFDWSSLDFLEEPDDVVDVKKLNDVELLDLERDLMEKLKNKGEMLNVHTDEGREIQSLRAAARIELGLRNLK